MWIGPALALAAGAWRWRCGVRRAARWPRRCSLLWLLSPRIAWWISQPPAAARVRTRRAQQRLPAQLARRTWAFFETYVGAADHWLPPDNLQEHPAPVVAHRTSPTNMGMALLANLAAHDFGYLGAGRLLERIAQTLATHATRCERHRGHFYNWYDTQTLQPLAPLYVSTVDSGNLAGHLLTLRPGLLEVIHDRRVPATCAAGLRDTLHVLHDALAARRTAAHCGPC